MARDGALPVLQDGLGVKRSLTRREMVQRLLAGAGAGAAWPLVAPSHPIHALLANDALLAEASAGMAAADWKSAVLTARQNESLAALSESIVPGSGKAQVNRFIDLLLSVDTRGNQEKFLASLSAFESESQKRFGKLITALAGSQRNELLTIASKEPPGGSPETLRDHFENLKGWISGAFYSSEAGMRELGWNGDYVFETYPANGPLEGHT